ncbi:MAG TPA: hypothetical protein VK171_06940 [Fimbriimonas sp.]|nr:hypothetical protein [Fimbriimonas sp.]
MASRKVNRQKRASIMIFAVVTMAAVGTILVASMDLGRLAYLKVKYAERKMRFQAHLDSIRAEYEERLYREGVATYTINVSNNRIRSETTGSLDAGWESPKGYQVQITSSYDQKTKSSTLKMGKRVMVNAADFSLVAGQITSSAEIKLDGDAAFGPIATFGVDLKMKGDIYGTATSPTAVQFVQGQYIGRQPKPKIVLNAPAYASIADVTTSGTQTMNSPSFGLPLLTSRSYYHTGNLTLSGTYSGKGTLFVNGTVTIRDFRALTGLDHAIIISTDGIVLEGGSITAVMITSGTVTTTAATKISISGSLAGNEVNVTQNLDIVQDTFISVNPLLNDFYRIPGAW